MAEIVTIPNRLRLRFVSPEEIYINGVRLDSPAMASDVILKCATQCPDTRIIQQFNVLHRALIRICEEELLCRT